MIFACILWKLQLAECKYSCTISSSIYLLQMICEEKLGRASRATYTVYWSKVIRYRATLCKPLHASRVRYYASIATRCLAQCVGLLQEKIVVTSQTCKYSSLLTSQRNKVCWWGSGFARVTCSLFLVHQVEPVYLLLTLCWSWRSKWSEQERLLPVSMVWSTA